MDRLKRCGRNVRISPFISIYSPETIEIGDNVRIDDFCILSGGAGGIVIGSHIHIAAGVYLFGGSGIHIEDFVQVSVRTTVFSQSDDFSGCSLVGPCIPEEYKPDFVGGPVRMCRHSLLGACCTVLPGVTLGEGSAVGAHSLVKDNTEAWSIYAGVPARMLKDRDDGMLELECAFLEAYGKRSL